MVSFVLGARRDWGKKGYWLKGTVSLDLEIPYLVLCSIVAVFTEDQKYSHCDGVYGIFYR